MQSSPDVDAYIEDSEQWPEVITALRPILLDAGLTEQIKWGKPCYSHDGSNVVILQEMKGFLALMFFKGALLEDPEGVLVDQGPNSRSARRIEFTSARGVARLTDTVRAYLDEAIDIEEAGLQVAPKLALEVVAELQDRLDRDPALKAAFESLTPGRQRQYNLYVGGAKHAKTRESRIDKHIERIKEGKGLRDR